MSRKLNHCKELEALGAKDGIKALRTLRQIEKEAHYWACVSCNGGFLYTDARGHEQTRLYELTEEEEDKIFTRLENRVKRVFGGKLPIGFMFNHDPRGYALKIKTEQNRIFVNSEDGSNRDERAISHTDWGGYGILAPEKFD